jgi:hypothetical protein
LLYRFKDVFYDPSDETLGSTTLGEFEVKLKPGSKPIYRPAYRLPPALKEEMMKIVKEHERLGLIEKTDKGEYSHPALLVRKPGTDPKKPQYRLVLDLRELNKNIENLALDLPNIQDLYDRIGENKATLFCSYDIMSAFNQIDVKENCRDLFAFSLPNGEKYRLRKMPMGGRTSAQKF